MKILDLPIINAIQPSLPHICFWGASWGLVFQMPSVAQKGKGGEGMRRRAVYAPDVGRPEKDMADGGAGAATAVVSYRRPSLRPPSARRVHAYIQEPTSRRKNGPGQPYLRAASTQCWAVIGPLYVCWCNWTWTYPIPFIFCMAIFSKSLHFVVLPWSHLLYWLKS